MSTYADDRDYYNAWEDEEYEKFRKEYMGNNFHVELNENGLIYYRDNWSGKEYLTREKAVQLYGMYKEISDEKAEAYFSLEEQKLVKSGHRLTKSAHKTEE